MSGCLEPIDYAVDPDLGAGEFIAVLEASGLAKRRPVDDPQRIQQMLGRASLIVTARSGGRLVGVARSLTDGAFCTYLSDLAVDPSVQGRGIGRELIGRTHAEAGCDITDLILLAAPEAETYYRHVGLQQFPQCFMIKRKR